MSVPRELRFAASIILCMAIVSIAVHAQDQLPQPASVPGGLTLEQTRVLADERAKLSSQLQDLSRRVSEHDARCNPVPEDNAGPCRASKAHIESDLAQYVDSLEQFDDRLEREVEKAAELKGQQVRSELLSRAKKLGWTGKEVDRVARALNDLGADTKTTALQIAVVWEDMVARKSDRALTANAKTGDGPDLPWAGQQTKYQDCAVFALANATARPYGLVAASAADLIREAQYRSPAERLQPRKTIETVGLNGGEIIMLSEAYGQVEVAPPSAFAATLEGGHPIMISVWPYDGKGAHQVVLSKAFQHENETWYELIDSNQGRLHLSSSELAKINQENGIVFRAEPGTVPRKLR